SVLPPRSAFVDARLSCRFCDGCPGPPFFPEKRLQRAQTADRLAQAFIKLVLFSRTHGICFYRMRKQKRLISFILVLSAAFQFHVPAGNRIAAAFKTLPGAAKVLHSRMDNRDQE